MQKALIEAVKSAVAMTIYEESGKGCKIPPQILINVMESNIDPYLNPYCLKGTELDDLHNMGNVLIELGMYLKNKKLQQVDMPIVKK